MAAYMKKHGITEETETITEAMEMRQLLKVIANLFNKQFKQFPVPLKKLIDTLREIDALIWTKPYGGYRSGGVAGSDFDMAAYMKKHGITEETETITEGFVDVSEEDHGLHTDLTNPKGKAVVDGKGKVIAVYRTERAARKHAETGKPVKEEVEGLTEAPYKTSTGTPKFVGKYQFTPFVEGSISGWFIRVQGFAKEVGFIEKPYRKNTKTSVVPHSVYFHTEVSGHPELKAHAWPSNETRVIQSSRIRFAAGKLLKAVAMWMDAYGYRMVGEGLESVDFHEGREWNIKYGTSIKDVVDEMGRRGWKPVDKMPSGNFSGNISFKDVEQSKAQLVVKGGIPVKWVFESVEVDGDTITEGSDYYAVEGTVDNQPGGAQTAPTMQEAEHYAKAMFAYLKKGNPKAKKITVEIYKVVNYERKNTPMKVLTVAEGIGDDINESVKPKLITPKEMADYKVKKVLAVGTKPNNESIVATSEWGEKKFVQLEKMGKTSNINQIVQATFFDTEKEAMDEMRDRGFKILKHHGIAIPHLESVDQDEEMVNEYHRRGRVRSSSHSGSPRWITAKYAGVDAYGKPFKKGEEVLYFPIGPNFYTGAEAERAWREFLSAKGDEEGMPYAS